MFFRFRNRINYVTKKRVLEQLEERIVLDAAAPAMVDQAMDSPEQANQNMDLFDVGPGSDNQSSNKEQRGTGEQPPDGSGDRSGTDLNLLLISNDLEHSKEFSAAAKQGTQVISYDADQAHMGAIVEKLSSLTNSTGLKIGELAIFSHGNIGELRLAQGEHINLSNIDSHGEDLSALGSLMSDDGRIDLYGCGIGKGPEGMRFIQTFADYTNADIWASDDPTGNAQGYDWDLEVGTGVGPAEALLDYSDLDSTTIRLDWVGTIDNSDNDITGTGSDCGNLDAQDGDDTITLESGATCNGDIHGGGGGDIIEISGTVGGASGGMIYGDGGDDYIEIRGSASISGGIEGGSGNDVVWIDVSSGWPEPSDPSDIVLDGGADNDVLTLFVSKSWMQIEGDAGSGYCNISGDITKNLFYWKNFEFINIYYRDAHCDVALGSNAEINNVYMGGGTGYKEFVAGHDSTFNDIIATNALYTEIHLRYDSMGSNIYGSGRTSGQDQIIVGNRVSINDIHLQGGFEDTVQVGQPNQNGAIVSNIFGAEERAVITVYHNSQIATIHGGDEPGNGDKITVYEGATVGYIYGEGGNDTIINGGAVQSIYGHAGDDIIKNCIGSLVANPGWGTVGAIINGGDGNDAIRNENIVTGDIIGGAGDDEIVMLYDGASGHIWGGAGKDTIAVGDGAAWLGKVKVNGNIYGQDQDDTITLLFDAEVNSIFGGPGMDYIKTWGTVSGDVKGGGGNDFIITRGGTVTGDIDGRFGRDLIEYNGGEIVGSIIGGDPGVYEGDTFFINPKPDDDTTPLISSGSCTVNGKNVKWEQMEYVDIGPANNPPVLGDENLKLDDISEDLKPADNHGNTVSEILLSGSSDPISEDTANPSTWYTGAGAKQKSIAVIGCDTTNGVWEYDTGSGWTDFGVISASKALLLSSIDSIRFIPNENWNGTVSNGLTIRAWDQAGKTAGLHGTKYDVSTYYGQYTAFSSATDTVSIKVNSVNDPPVANDDGLGPYDADTAGLVGPLSVLLANDTDPDGDDLKVTKMDASSAKGVNITLNAGDNSFTYQLNGEFDYLKPGETATDTFDYTISDGNGGEDTATVTMTITGVNDPPVAVDDELEPPIGADTAGLVGPLSVLLSNDTDPDGDDPEVYDMDESSAAGAEITWTTSGVGSFSYQLNGKFDYLAQGDTATDTFEYKISDGNGKQDTATVTMTIRGVNDPPVAVNDTASTNEDSPKTIDVLDNDGDVDGDPLSITKISTDIDGDGNFGKVSISGDKVIYDPNGQFEHLALGDSSTDTFEYTISDGKGGEDTATVAMTITGVNDPPVAVNDTLTTDENTPITFDSSVILFNDDDIDTGDTLSVDSVDTSSTLGLLTWDKTADQFNYDPNGQFDHLSPGQTGTDTFKYTISDGNGGEDDAIVTVEITGANNAPEVTVPNSVAGDEDKPITISGISVSDPDDTSLNIKIRANDGSFSLAQTTGLTFTTGDGASDYIMIFSGDRTDINNALNNLTYQGDLNFNGSDKLEISVSDGLSSDYGATIVNLAPVNDTPTWSGIPDIIVDEDSPDSLIDLYAYFDDVEDPDPQLDYTIISNSNPGLFSELNISDPSNFTLDYAPDANGVAVITIRAADTGGLWVEDGFRVTVRPVNDAPTSGGVPDPDPVAQAFGVKKYDVSNYFEDIDGPTMNYELGALMYHDGLILSDVSIDPKTGVITFQNDPNTWGAVDVQVRANDTMACCNWQTFTFIVEPEPVVQPNQDTGGDPAPNPPGQYGGDDRSDYYENGDKDAMDSFTDSFSILSQQFADSSVSHPSLTTIVQGSGLAPLSPGSQQDRHDADQYEPEFKGLGDSYRAGPVPISQWKDLLNDAAYDPDKQVRENAWKDLFGSLAQYKDIKRTEHILGLEAFLKKLRKFHESGYDFDFTLAFNAEEILLAEWLESGPSEYDQVPASAHWRSAPSRENQFQFPQGAQIFDIDEINLVDLLKPETRNGQSRGGVHAPSPYEGEISQCFDMNNLRMTDIWRV